MTPHTDHRDDADDALARAARRAHAASLDQLSPRVQAQLAQRRRAATQPGRSAGRGWAMIAATSATALALAIGVFVLRDDGMDAAQMADAPESDAPPATLPAPAVDTRIVDAATTPPTVDSADAPAVDPAVDPADAPATTPIIEAMPHDDTALPDTLIAAEFDGVEAIESAIDDAGYDGFDETPDFYAWLGSEEALAEAPESL